MSGVLSVFQWNAIAATAVGSSTIIHTLDYSDTFTVNGTTRLDNAFPTGSGLLVENPRSNPAESWSVNAWKMVTNSSTTNGTLHYPGDSGAGSSTGLAQIAAQSARTGINYTTDGTSTGTPLRSIYAVQVDAVLTTGRIEITSKSSAGAELTDSGSLSVFFRPEGISIYNFAHNETLVAAAPTGFNAGTWQNLAVTFAPNTLKIYTNQILLLTVDLTDVGVNHFNYTGYSQQAVGIGFQTPDLGEWAWFDNFQVGAAPEPNSLLLIITGVIFMSVRRRQYLR